MRQTEELKTKIQHEGDEFKKKAEQHGNEFLEGGKEMANEAESKAYELGYKAKRALSEAEDYAKEGSEYFESQVKSAPLLSIAAAFVVGVIFGKISSLTKN